MILKASQRAGGKQLAVHLLRDDENDHVELHQIRGFAADDLKGALREAYAISRGTKCTQYLFSVSFSPPQEEKVSVATFEATIDELERRIGLSGQPRVIVFHEKNGRRHAHCVWSRIRADDLRAVNMAHFKLKLRELSRELYIENGWKMPVGLVNSEERNPLNFTRDEWQQAKRISRDAAGIKAAFQDSWATSDSRQAFIQALEARGYYLAQGDRRGFVAVDYLGEVYSFSRWSGIRAKDLSKRLGDPVSLPSVDERKRHLKDKVAEKLASFAAEIKGEFETARLGLLEQKKRLVTWQRDERAMLRELQAAREMAEARTRSERFRSGLKGLWDRLIGRHATIARANEADFFASKRRDAAEHQALVDRQLAERRALQRQIVTHRDRMERNLATLETSKRQKFAKPEIRVIDDPTRRPLRRRGLTPDF
ncbi:relaxase/mobilization nuclease domain-containing protein [Siccirubricoccus phaeus]|uniref:relaxase/mobilization nuclease domain-containing protein n=1 Tax=Siccirubricoccus phaeus TaxID=2595053 RepID=UPI0011F1CF56|nr:relaxase [Siccirubricoccus phaeus]